MTQQQRQLQLMPHTDGYANRNGGKQSQRLKATTRLKVKQTLTSVKPSFATLNASNHSNNVCDKALTNKPNLYRLVLLLLMSMLMVMMLIVLDARCREVGQLKRVVKIGATFELPAHQEAARMFEKTIDTLNLVPNYASQRIIAPEHRSNVHDTTMSMVSQHQQREQQERRQQYTSTSHHNNRTILDLDSKYFGHLETTHVSDKQVPLASSPSIDDSGTSADSTSGDDETDPESEEQIELVGLLQPLSSGDDAHELDARVCSLLANGARALVGPLGGTALNHLESMCESLEVAHVTFSPSLASPSSIASSVNNYNSNTKGYAAPQALPVVQPTPTASANALAVDLAPAAHVLARAYMDLIDAWNWTSFAIVYDSNLSMIRLQDLFRQSSGTWTNKWAIRLFPSTVDVVPPETPVTTSTAPHFDIKHSSSSSSSQHAESSYSGEHNNFRSVFWQVRVSGETNVLLDVRAEHVDVALRHAQQVGCLTDTFSYLLTTLDVHTLQLEDFRYARARITALSLVPTVVQVPPSVDDNINNNNDETPTNNLDRRQLLAHASMRALNVPHATQWASDNFESVTSKPNGPLPVATAAAAATTSQRMTNADGSEQGSSSTEETRAMLSAMRAARVLEMASQRQRAHAQWQRTRANAALVPTLEAANEAERLQQPGNSQLLSHTNTASLGPDQLWPAVAELIGHEGALRSPQVLNTYHFNVSTHAALVHDASVLLALAVGALGADVLMARPAPTCDAHTDPSYVSGEPVVGVGVGTTLVNYMRRVQFYGLSGPVLFDERGARHAYTLDVLVVAPAPVALVKVAEWRHHAAMSSRRRLSIVDGKQWQHFYRTGTFLLPQPVVPYLAMNDALVRQQLLLNSAMGGTAGAAISGSSIAAATAAIDSGIAATPDESETLIVTTRRTQPYFMLKETPVRQEGNDQYEGFAVDLIHELSKLVGFRYRFKEVADGKYGARVKRRQRWPRHQPLPLNARIISTSSSSSSSLSSSPGAAAPNITVRSNVSASTTAQSSIDDTIEIEVDTWNGMIGEIIEGKADLAIVDLTITSQREEAVDFTLPFMSTGISILFKKPTTKVTTLFSFLSPFSSHVWALVLVAYASISATLYVVGRVSPYEWTRAHECLCFGDQSPPVDRDRYRDQTSASSSASPANDNYKQTRYNLTTYNGANCATHFVNNLAIPASETTTTTTGTTTTFNNGAMAPQQQLYKQQQHQPHEHQQHSNSLDTQSGPANNYWQSKRPQFTMSNAFWFTIGSLMQQGSDLTPKSMSARTIAAIWYFFTLIMISSYTANLAAFLTVERVVYPIESAKDLSEQDEIKYGCVESGSTCTFFADSQIDVYRRIGDQIKRHKTYVKSNDEGKERVERGQFAFFMESTSIEYIVERACNLTQIGGLLDTKGYGVATSKRLRYVYPSAAQQQAPVVVVPAPVATTRDPIGNISAQHQKLVALPTTTATTTMTTTSAPRLKRPYRTLLSEGILHLQESGALHALKDRWWKERRGGGTCSDDAKGSAVTELSLANVGGVFVVLLAGLALSFLVAICEFMWCARPRRLVVACPADDCQLCNTSCTDPSTTYHANNNGRGRVSGKQSVPVTPTNAAQVSVCDLMMRELSFALACHAVTKPRQRARPQRHMHVHMHANDNSNKSKKNQDSSRTNGTSTSSSNNNNNNGNRNCIVSDKHKSTTTTSNNKSKYQQQQQITRPNTNNHSINRQQQLALLRQQPNLMSLDATQHELLLNQLRLAEQNNSTNIGTSRAHLRYQ
ncbi:Glutamate receptor ionotropic, kainate 1 [Fragariocoptes setiger]|uniref:Glutamate receptor ionotropic, kainate 1 n=1 Tax=Fragariocoptes setiger TaxID=1670756 RepID=A0ABQ7S7F0_9ACAR|nr:Glutamate receptor ionotropic, kainate 1 [Fragariocoptes setiger]